KKKNLRDPFKITHAARRKVHDPDRRTRFCQRQKHDAGGRERWRSRQKTLRLESVIQQFLYFGDSSSSAFSKDLQSQKKEHQGNDSRRLEAYISGGGTIDPPASANIPLVGNKNGERGSGLGYKLLAIGSGKMGPFRCSRLALGWSRSAIKRRLSPD
ncbi:alpha/beta-Hydrolases superfamily protein, partial [Striga asiatica]